MSKRFLALTFVLMNCACSQSGSNFGGSQKKEPRSANSAPSIPPTAKPFVVKNQHSTTDDSPEQEDDLPGTNTATAIATDTDTETATAEPPIAVERAIEHIGVSACANLDQTSDAPGIYAAPDGPSLDPAPSLIEPIVMTRGNSIYRADYRYFGRVIGNVGNGSWCLISPLGANGGTIITDQSGRYNQIIPAFCGEQILKLTWTGADNKTLVATTKISRTGCVSEENGMRVTLSWGPEADDLEAHLIRQGGRINNHDGRKDDCTWTSCVNSRPDWGVVGDRSDDPTKDSDWRGNNGLENIVLSKLEAINYDVMVEYWRVGQPTSARVVVNIKGKPHVVTVPALGTHEVWHVARIDGASGEVTIIDQIIECASNWGSGCRKALP